MKISANKRAYIKAKIEMQRFIKSISTPLALAIEAKQIESNGGLKYSYLGVNRSNSNAQLIGISKKPLTRGQARQQNDIRQSKVFSPRNSITMRKGTYYLNNSGHRWVVYDNGKKPIHTFKTESGKEIKRTAIYYESFGNFATVCISYKGQKIRVFADQTLKD
jgi:hypothetical protein